MFVHCLCSFQQATLACFVQQAERLRVWQGIRVSMAHKLTGIWDEPGIRAWLKQVMPNMFTSSTSVL